MRVKYVLCSKYAYVLLLLYDGHSAGAQIIDFMILVVDVVKGIQTQTAEVHMLVCCIV